MYLILLQERTCAHAPKDLKGSTAQKTSMSARQDRRASTMAFASTRQDRLNVTAREDLRDRAAKSTSTSAIRILARMTELVSMNVELSVASACRVRSDLFDLNAIV